MCLGAIGVITDVWDEGGMAMALVSIVGGAEPVSLMYVPEAKRGDRVLVHIGFAIEVLDPGVAADAGALRSTASSVVGGRGGDVAMSPRGRS